MSAVQRCTATNIPPHCKIANLDDALDFLAVLHAVEHLQATDHGQPLGFGCCVDLLAIDLDVVTWCGLLVVHLQTNPHEKLLVLPRGGMARANMPSAAFLLSLKNHNLLLAALTSDIVMTWLGGEVCATCRTAASRSASWPAWRPTRTNSAVEWAPLGRQE